MKFKITFLALIGFFLFHVSKAQEKVIVIGNGGGFTGSVTAYKIASNGEIFKGSGLVEIKYTLCAKLKKSKAKKIIQQASAEILATQEFNHPGNVYTFLAVEDGKENKRLTWGHNTTPAPEKILTLHAEIMKTISSLNYKPIQK
jgi:hypothetical protein